MRINYYNNIDKKLKITMATKRKSIIEEALLEAKSLEDALKANTKEMLATHMKQEIESIVESSLKVKDEESKNDIVEGSDEKTEVPVLKEQKEDVVRYDDLDEKGKAIWEKQGKPIPKKK